MPSKKSSVFEEEMKMGTKTYEIVDSVEARKISPEKIANKTVKILNKKRKKFVYSINRNPLLLLLNILPARFQTFIIRKILEN